jgi:hypothetical protein
MDALGSRGARGCRHPACGLHALHTDLDRFTFLLGGTDGEDLFGQY